MGHAHLRAGLCDMDLELVAFFALAIATLGGALCVVLPPMARNPLHAAVALLATFCALAGLFVLLAAHLVAVLQVLIYAGAVMVLFTFVIMLLNLRPHELAGPKLTANKALGALAVLALMAKMGVLVWAASLDVQPPKELYAEFGWVRDVGGRLLIDYLVPFELTSVLLLVAVIGAMTVARRTPAGGKG